MTGTLGSLNPFACPAVVLDLFLLYPPLNRFPPAYQQPVHCLAFGRMYLQSTGVTLKKTTNPPPAICQNDRVLWKIYILKRAFSPDE